MPSFLSILNSLNLNKKLCRFLTRGYSNGFSLFFYKLFDKKVLFEKIIIDKTLYPIHFLNLPVILLISLLLFSKFFEIKKTHFQEHFLIKKYFFPSIFFFILIELFLTTNFRIGVYCITILESFLFILLYFHVFDIFFLNLYLFFLTICFITICFLKRYLKKKILQNTQNVFWLLNNISFV